MTPVFLDTVGLIALWDESDQWHEHADAAFRALADRSAPLVTTTFVLLECGNAAARRPYRNEVVALGSALQARGELLVPTEADWLAAWTAYEQGSAGDAGIVDQTSFAVMRRLGIKEAFSNDRHFKAAGFTTLF